MNTETYFKKEDDKYVLDSINYENHASFSWTSVWWKSSQW